MSDNEKQKRLEASRRMEQEAQEHYRYMMSAPRCRCGSGGGICNKCRAGLCDDCRRSHRC